MTELRLKKNVTYDTLKKYNFKIKKQHNYATYETTAQENFIYSYLCIGVQDRTIFGTNLVLLYDLIQDNLVEKVTF